MAFITLNIHGRNTGDSCKTIHKLWQGMHVAPAGATYIGNYKQLKGNDIELRSRLGFIAGLHFQYQLTQKFALCLETNYESKGSMIINTRWPSLINYHCDYITIVYTDETEPPIPTKLYHFSEAY